MALLIAMLHLKLGIAELTGIGTSRGCSLAGAIIRRSAAAVNAEDRPLLLLAAEIPSIDRLLP